MQADVGSGRRGAWTNMTSEAPGRDTLDDADDRQPWTLRRAWDWLLGRDPPKPPNPDKTVEAAWLPLWQSQMVTDTLNDAGVPAVVVDDYSINPMMYAREPMARIFVTEDRKAEAEALIEELIGHPPRHRGL